MNHVSGLNLSSLPSNERTQKGQRTCYAFAAYRYAYVSMYIGLCYCTNLHMYLNVHACLLVHVYAWSYIWQCFLKRDAFALCLMLDVSWLVVSLSIVSSEISNKLIYNHTVVDGSKETETSLDFANERSESDKLVDSMDFGELCNEFECISSPQVESTARQLARDILEMREGNRALGSYSVSVKYKVIILDNLF